MPYECHGACRDTSFCGKLPIASAVCEAIHLCTDCFVVPRRKTGLLAKTELYVAALRFRSLNPACRRNPGKRDFSEQCSQRHGACKWDSHFHVADAVHVLDPPPTSFGLPPSLRFGGQVGGSTPKACLHAEVPDEAHRMRARRHAAMTSNGQLQ